jgi:hypothetical protein
VEKLALKREISHLEQINEELAEQAPPPPGVQQGFPDPTNQSQYTALTTHSLVAPSAPAKESAQSSSSKSKRKRRRKKGGARNRDNASPVQDGLPETDE